MTETLRSPSLRALVGVLPCCYSQHLPSDSVYTHCKKNYNQLTNFVLQKAGNPMVAYLVNIFPAFDRTQENQRLFTAAWLWILPEPDDSTPTSHTVSIKYGGISSSPRFPKWLFHSGLMSGSLCADLIASMPATCPKHPPPFDHSNRTGSTWSIYIQILFKNAAWPLTNKDVTRSKCCQLGSVQPLGLPTVQFYGYGS